MQLATARAAMDDDPFTVFAYADRDRLHRGAAFGGTVARRIVEVTAPQAIRTVVAVRGARRMQRDVEPAVATAEGVGTRRTRAMTLIACQGRTSSACGRVCGRRRASGRGEPSGGIRPTGVRARRDIPHKLHRVHASPPPVGSRHQAVAGAAHHARSPAVKRFFDPPKSAWNQRGTHASGSPTRSRTAGGRSPLARSASVTRSRMARRLARTATHTSRKASAAPL